MRILMVSDVYFPRVNGVSSSIRTFAVELVRLGHEVTVVAPAYPHGGAGPDDGLEIVRLPASYLFFDPEDRLITKRAMRDAIDALARRAFDVVHIHTPFRAHRLGVTLAKRLGVPTVETYHTYFEQYGAHYLPWLPPVFSRWAARAFSRRLCHEVDHLIVPTREMAKVLDDYGIRTPASVIPTGLSLDEFRRGDGAAFRKRHGIPADAPTLVTVSRLAREKNIELLFDAARLLVDEFPDLVFIVAGEGPDAARLAEHAKAIGLGANVRFFGYLERGGELLDCYRAGDVFVFASPTETQGLVLIEAMALGVPIVSTAVMGTATVLRDAKSAVIVDESPAAFASALAPRLRSRDAREALAAHGPADARRFSAGRLMEDVVALYHALSHADHRRAIVEADPARP